MTDDVVKPATDLALSMTETASSPSAAAARMRAFRRRRRKGLRCLRVQIGPAEIDRLIANRYLGPTERENVEAIETAASWFLSDALMAGIRNV